jgi:hypothetical protein
MLSAKESISNKKNALTNSETEYPSSKAVKTFTDFFTEMYNFLFEGVLDENNTLLNYPKNTRV